MKVIVGLGNPWIAYEKTRHNTGFLFLDFLSSQSGWSSWVDSKFFGLISEGVYKGEKCILLKPTTFMNVSGKSVQALCQFYKINPQTDICVVYDDVSMDFGKIRFRLEGSAGGHNGIKSITQTTGSHIFPRIKIGIGNNSKYDLSDWVLGKFTGDELTELQTDVFMDAQEILEEKF